MHNYLSEHKVTPLYLDKGFLWLAGPALYLYANELSSQFLTEDFYHVVKLCVDYGAIVVASTAGLLFAFGFVNRNSK